MPSAGDVVISLRSEQATIKPAMESAASSVDGLRDSVTGTHSHFERFNLHALASRHAIGTFALATGQAAGPLSHLVHGFMLAPGPIGAAIGAILLFRHMMEASSKATEEATKKQAEWHKGFMETQKAMSGKTESPMEKQMDAEQKRLESVRAEMKALAADISHGKSTPDEILKAIDVTRYKGAHVEQIRRLDELSSAAVRSAKNIENLHKAIANEGMGKPSFTHGHMAAEVEASKLEHEPVMPFGEIVPGTGRKEPPVPVVPVVPEAPKWKDPYEGIPNPFGGAIPPGPDFGLNGWAKKEGIAVPPYAGLPGAIMQSPAPASPAREESLLPVLMEIAANTRAANRADFPSRQFGGA